MWRVFTYSLHDLGGFNKNSLNNYLINDARAYAIFELYDVKPTKSPATVSRTKAKSTNTNANGGLNLRKRHIVGRYLKKTLKFKNSKNKYKERFFLKQDSSNYQF